MLRQRSLDDLELTCQARIVHARPAPGHLSDAFTRKNGGQGGGRGGVANAHVTADKDVCAAVYHAVCGFDADRKGLLEFLGSHSGLL